jgi:hypothetical protein
VSFSILLNYYQVTAYLFNITTAQNFNVKLETHFWNLIVIPVAAALSLLQKPSTVSRKADPKNTKVCNGACSGNKTTLIS